VLVPGKLRDNFRGLADVWEFLRVAPRLRAAHVLKARLPVADLLQRFTPPVRCEPQEDHVGALQRYVWWWLGRRWLRVPGNCWTRSLVLFELLRRHGFGDVRLIVGVRKDAEDLAGHAWLERGGQPFLEPDSEEVRGMKPLIEHPTEEAPPP
jgi:hypothetical protein